MRHPGQGAFSKDAMPKSLQRLTPSECAHSITEVDLNQLKESGKRLILLDVDNTLLPWKGEAPSEEVRAWLDRGRELGFSFTILSNTRHPERLDRIAASMGLPYVRDKFKPSRKMYDLALEKAGAKPEDAVMIGDQLLTDVLGANRAGIDAIWVQRIHKKEFIGTTLISRNIERILAIFLRKYFEGDVPAGFFGRSVVRQFLKFGVVGGIATFVDVGIHWFLMYRADWGGSSLSAQVGAWSLDLLDRGQGASLEQLHDAAYAPLKIGPVFLAILTSYLLNRVWTFGAGDEKMSIQQVGKFYMVAIIGMIISITVGSLVKAAIVGGEQTTWALATLSGIVVGFLWNFNGQRLWTFRQGRKE